MYSVLNAVYLHNERLNGKTKRAPMLRALFLNPRWPMLSLFPMPVHCDDAVGQLSDPCCVVPCAEHAVRTQDESEASRPRYTTIAGEIER